MNQYGSRILLFLFLALGALAAHAGSKSKPSATTKQPVRIHYSGNLEGELEPCG